MCKERSECISDIDKKNSHNKRSKSSLIKRYLLLTIECRKMIIVTLDSEMELTVNVDPTARSPFRTVRTLDTSSQFLVPKFKNRGIVPMISSQHLLKFLLCGLSAMAAQTL